MSSLSEFTKQVNNHVACPTCKAAVKEPCKSKSKNSTARSVSHDAREKAYVKMMHKQAPWLVGIVGTKAKKPKKRKRKSKPPVNNYRQKYELYMSSPQWQAVRTERLAMDDAFCCWTCGIRNFVGGKHVHHRSYANFTNENMDELVVTCAECNLKRIPKVVALLKRKRIVQANYQWIATDFVRMKYRGDFGPGALITTEIYSKILNASHT